MILLDTIVLLYSYISCDAALSTSMCLYFFQGSLRVFVSHSASSRVINRTHNSQLCKQRPKSKKRGFSSNAHTRDGPARCMQLRPCVMWAGTCQVGKMESISGLQL
ncbi:hypothetical protein V8C40DRAFT_242370 [Trichoderma camerunense]